MLEPNNLEQQGFYHLLTVWSLMSHSIFLSLNFFSSIEWKRFCKDQRPNYKKFQEQCLSYGRQSIIIDITVTAGIVACYG